MRNKIIHYLFYLVVMLVVFCSCAEQEQEEYSGQKAVELKLSCLAPNQTRADDVMGGEQALNENLIRTLHYFFYPIGGTSENAIMAGSMDLNLNTQGEAIIRIPVNDAEVNGILFPRPANECEMYVIANLPEEVIIPAETSVDILKTLVINSDFKSEFPQSAFIMDGLGKAKLIDRNKTLAASAEIPVDRLAAKFTVRISVASSYTDTDGAVWTPDLTKLSVKMSNAAKQTTVAATPGEELFDYEAREQIGTKVEPVDGVNRTFYIFRPFYSYPRQWDYKSSDALSFYVVLPWQSTTDGRTSYEDCYYKVYPNTMQLERNNWYNVDLHIGVLGSFEPQIPPLVIENLTYKVVDWKNGYLDWQSGLQINTELLGAHYLIVQQNAYTVNNKNQYTIPFMTSHECTIENLKVTVPDFGTDSNPKKTDRDVTQTAIDNNWLTLDGSSIRLNHPLNNDFVNTINYDYAPYTFSFTLCHKNNPERFNEPITIVQNPAIMIEACLNSDYAANPNNQGGFQFVNGTMSNDDGDGDYGGAWGLRGGNKNPNMYVITTTVLPPGSDFILGDPRTEGVNNSPGNNAVTAPGIEGGANRKLSWYHPTIEDNSVENMISPKFRIASSYGVTSDVSHDEAVNRAATYQEDGYPAGRWRVPTKAEVRFIIKLSSDGKIPTLFSNGSAYWCANGTVTPKSGGGYTIGTSTSGKRPVRCVYDDWYWEQSAVPRLNNYNIFTWGDESAN